MIGSTSCLYRCTLVLAFAALNLFNLVTCMLALLAWSSIPLGYPDLLNLNPSILALSLYSTLLLSMTRSGCRMFLSWPIYTISGGSSVGVGASQLVLCVYWSCYCSSFPVCPSVGWSVSHA